MTEEAKQWALGDWLVDGKRHYGDGLYKPTDRGRGTPNKVSGQNDHKLNTGEALAKELGISPRTVRRNARFAVTVDAKKWTQKRVAETLGVAQQTVADWLSTNTGAGNTTSAPDARVKLNSVAQNTPERPRWRFWPGGRLSYRESTNGPCRAC